MLCMYAWLHGYLYRYFFLSHWSNWEDMEIQMWCIHVCDRYILISLVKLRSYGDSNVMYTCMW
jgi:hypothetical protein